MKKQCIDCHIPNCGLDDGASIEDCPINKALKIIGGKRTMVTLIQLQTPKRYGELKRVLPDISEKMLITTLHTLAEYELITNTLEKTKVPKSTYIITPLGTKALQIATQLAEIGKTFA